MTWMRRMISRILGGKTETKKRSETPASTSKRELEGKVRANEIHWAAITSSARLRLLLTFGADPNARDEKGNTPLHAVASLGSYSFSLTGEARNPTEDCRVLIEAGADPDARNDDGATPEELAWKPEIKKILGEARREREAEVLAAEVDAVAPAAAPRRRRL